MALEGWNPYQGSYLAQNQAVEKLNFSKFKS